MRQTLPLRRALSGLDRKLCIDVETCHYHASEQRSAHVPAAKERIVICRRRRLDDFQKRRSIPDQLQNAILDGAQHVPKVEQVSAISYRAMTRHYSGAQVNERQESFQSLDQTAQ